MTTPPSVRLTETRIDRTTPHGRIVAIDLARLLAIVGMMAAHLLLPEERTWLSEVSTGFPSTLFAVVGGVSAILSTRRYSAVGLHLAAGLSLATRGVVVAGIGLLLDLAPSRVLVVLVYLGVSMIAAAFLLRVPAVVLLAGAVVLALAGPFLNLAVRSGSEASPYISLDGPAEFLRSVFVTGNYPVVTWLVYVMIGMALAKAMLRAVASGREREFALRTLSAAAVVAVVAIAVDLLTRASVVRELVSTAALTESDARDLVSGDGSGAPLGTGWNVIVNATPHTGSFGDIARTAAVAVAVIAILLLVTRGIRSPTALPLRPFASAGGAPLTIYTLHVLLTSVTLIPAAFEGGPDAEAAQFATLGIHIVGALVMGAVLAVTGRRGPLEWLTSLAASGAARIGRRSGIQRRHTFVADRAGENHRPR